MELKKSPKADLENKKSMFFQIGLVLSLGLCLLAFEWKSYDKSDTAMFQAEIKNVEEEIIPITRQEVKPPPPAPIVQTTVLEIVDDKQEVADVNIDAEADKNTVVEEYVPVETKEEEKVVELEIFKVVEEAPEFPGGDESRIKFMQENIKYPQLAKESGISGTVFVTFVVEPNGAITDVKILRGIGGGCDEEAIRVVKNMPKWKAGKQRGKAVRVQFNMPIKFTLQG